MFKCKQDLRSVARFFSNATKDYDPKNKPVVGFDLSGNPFISYPSSNEMPVIAIEIPFYRDLYNDALIYAMYRDCLRSLQMSGDIKFGEENPGTQYFLGMYMGGKE